MAKRRNQRRKDGRVAVQVYLGRREDGTREYRTVYGKTQKEADEKAVRLKLDLKKGLDVSAAVIPSGSGPSVGPPSSPRRSAPPV